jgi:hypothetical protein
MCSRREQPLRFDAGFAGDAYPFFDIGMHRLRELLRAVAGRRNALL